MFYLVGEFINVINWIGHNLLLYSYNFFAIYIACREAYTKPFQDNGLNEIENEYTDNRKMTLEIKGNQTL